MAVYSIKRRPLRVRMIFARFFGAENDLVKINYESIKALGPSEGVSTT